MEKYFNNFHLSFREKLRIIRTYDKGDVSCFFSPTIHNAEINFSKYIGMPYGLAVTNCTSALFLAFKCLNIKNDEHIIIPNFTHPSTAFAAKSANLKFKLCDCEPNSYNLNLEQLSKLVDSKTRCVVFVHLRGYVQNIKEVLNFCKNHNLILIEDVAQGLGIKINNKMAGSFGDISCFSFNDSKTLQLGEGGICLFKNKVHEEYARKVIHEGEFASSTNLSSTISNGSVQDIIYNKFCYINDGFNFRPFPPIFSIIDLRIKKLRKLQKKKYCIRNIYEKYIDRDKFKTMQIFDGDFPICFPVLVNEKNKVETILSNTYNTGFPIGKMVYPNLNEISAFYNNCLNIKDDFRNSQNLYEKLVFLPLSKNITPKQAKKLILHLNKVVNLKQNTINMSSEIKNFDGLYLW